jgi:DNA polymerase III subunit epsilon
MRQIVLDVETTGLEASAGHRIIEIGCVEILNRRPTGQRFHRFLNPEREIDAGAQAVHGIDLARLAQAPKFSEIAVELIAFIEGAELIIHNAPFDVGFLDAEFARLSESRTIAQVCKVLDTLALARSLHPGQRNSLDALCKRYSVDNTKREFHGALLDMSGGRGESTRNSVPSAPIRAPGVALMVTTADADELRQHEAMLDLIAKASGGKAVWRNGGDGKELT